MKLPAGLGKLDWSDWLYGLFSGLVTGGSTAGVAAFGISVTDQQHAVSLKVVWSIFLAGAVLGMLTFLRQKPLPKKIVETTATVSTVLGIPVASSTSTKVTGPAEPPQ